MSRFKSPGLVSEPTSDQLGKFAPGSIPGARINAVDDDGVTHATFTQTTQPDFPIHFTGNKGGGGDGGGSTASTGPNPLPQPSSGAIKGKGKGGK